jgi:peptidoglycan-associated lipoprotein
MVTEEELKKADPLLVERKIYYDFDKYEIKPKFVPIIAAHARFLIAHPTVKVFVEGNCDDRGSPEYNVALGQRRSESVGRALLALGVPARQVEAVSYGAEKPVAYGSNEETWALNRRSDIGYPILKR